MGRKGGGGAERGRQRPTFVISGRMSRGYLFLPPRGERCGATWWPFGILTGVRGEGEGEETTSGGDFPKKTEGTRAKVVVDGHFRARSSRVQEESGRKRGPWKEERKEASIK